MTRPGRTAAKQLTVRGFDPELQREIHALARQEGLSLNQAALELLRRGAGLRAGHRRRDVVGDSLDSLIGRWSAADEAALSAALDGFETIDPALWR